MTDDEKIAVVTDILDSWSAQDWDRVESLFAPDGVLHSVMSTPIVGREAFAARVGRLHEGLERIQLHIKAIGVIDGRVWVERVDDFDVNGHHGEVPVVGILRVEDGMVTEWLEYYDRATLLRGMGVQPAHDFRALSAPNAMSATVAGDTVGSLLAASLRRGGDRVALRARGEIRTHRELLDDASRFANALAGLGVRPGDHVALMLADRVESVEAYLGCFLGGFPAVHVNDRLAPPEMAAVLSGADARVLVYTDSVAGTVADVASVPDVVVAIGEPAVAGHRPWARLIADAAADHPQVLRGPDDLAIVGYTSGTTGTPKGVTHSQRTLLRILQHMPVHFSATPRGRCAFTGTLSFVAGIWGVLLPHLYLGGEVSFMAGLAPDEWFDRMVAERSTFTYVPTPLAGAFVEQVHRRPEVLDSLRVAIHSGSKMPAGVVHSLVDTIGSRFITSYGMTETGAPVTRTLDEDWGTSCPADDVFASAGRPVHIADIAIVDAAGSALPPGRNGEILVGSQTLFTGYYRRPEMTAEAMLGGRLRTGDIGYLDEAGYLYVTDRAKDMVVSGGMNIYPAEVEAALAGLPGLAELAVFGVPDERWGETVVAVAVVDDPSIDEAAIIRAARERLASYKKPTRVRFADALPRTASLKIDKPALRRQWLDMG